MYKFAFVAALIGATFLPPVSSFAQADNASAAAVPVDGEAFSKLLETLILEQGVNIIVENIKASERESGDLDKAVRATLGISILDIKKYGLLGGPNSEMRKLFKALGIK